MDESDVESMYVEVFACGRMLGIFAAKKSRLVRMRADAADFGGDKFKVKVIAAAEKLAVGVARLAGAAEQTFLGYDETPTSLLPQMHLRARSNTSVDQQ